MKSSNLKVKKGDLVEMLSGKDRGKRGKILKVFPEKQRVVVEGLNVVRKHRRPKKTGDKGEVVSVPRSVNVSNVMVVCSKCGEPTRVGFKVVEGKKYRICKKCQSEL